MFRWQHIFKVDRFKEAIQSLYRQHGWHIFIAPIVFFIWFLISLTDRTPQQIALMIGIGTACILLSLFDGKQAQYPDYRWRYIVVNALFILPLFAFYITHQQFPYPTIATMILYLMIGYSFITATHDFEQTLSQLLQALLTFLGISTLSFIAIASFISIFWLLFNPNYAMNELLTHLLYFFIYFFIPAGAYFYERSDYARLSNWIVRIIRYVVFPLFLLIGLIVIGYVISPHHFDPNLIRQLALAYFSFGLSYLMFAHANKRMNLIVYWSLLIFSLFILGIQIANLNRFGITFGWYFASLSALLIIAWTIMSQFKQLASWRLICLILWLIIPYLPVIGIEPIVLASQQAIPQTEISRDILSHFDAKGHYQDESIYDTATINDDLVLRPEIVYFNDPTHVLETYFGQYQKVTPIDAKQVDIRRQDSHIDIVINDDKFTLQFDDLKQTMRDENKMIPLMHGQSGDFILTNFNGSLNESPDHWIVEGYYFTGKVTP